MSRRILRRLRTIINWRAANYRNVENNLRPRAFAIPFRQRSSGITFALFEGAARCRLPFGHAKNRIRSKVGSAPMSNPGSDTTERTIALDSKDEKRRGSGARSSRREILQWFAMAGAGSLLPAADLLARAARPAAAALSGRIDVHSHTVPPFYTKVMEKEILATGHPLPKWTPALHI
jgi:hypothetical protein